MTEITREQAIEILESREWRKWSSEQRCYFQLKQRRLCMPFDVFHKAVKEQLCRPVWTHEFTDSALLLSELEGIIPKPTWEQIIEPIKDRIIVIEEAKGADNLR